ncbi:TrmH family RNA methyltransferase [Herpetosiphon sp. NSE202]|uniref:TrmH family RNA methyltransferase n=1 Tax=Herpetosiphon sp. NSE202 TaxID=3351349 RepID=UPI003636D118
MPRKPTKPSRQPASQQRPAKRTDRNDRSNNYGRKLPAQAQKPAPVVEQIVLPDIVKEIRQLRSRDARDRTGTYYIEGARIVAQAINAGLPIEIGAISLELLSRTEHSNETVSALRKAAKQMVELSISAFSGISFKENLQGIGAVVKLEQEPLSNVQLTDRPWVALNGVGNPGNLGAIMRTCDAVGCEGLILIGDTTDPYHPAAIRASMGSLFALRMVRTNFEEFGEWKKANGYHVIGTTPDVEQEYQTISYPSPAILLMGSERLGLSVVEQSICDTLVRIPMAGTCDSLNLGVATSIVLYEMFRQQRLAQ